GGVRQQLLCALANLAVHEVPVRLIQAFDEQGGAAICSKQFRGLEQTHIDVSRRLLDHQIEVAHRHGATIGAIEQAADLILNTIENHHTQTLWRPVFSEKRLK